MELCQRYIIKLYIAIAFTLLFMDILITTQKAKGMMIIIIIIHFCYSYLTQIVVVSVYSSIDSFTPSLPIPEYLQPPNGRLK